MKGNDSTLFEGTVAANLCRYRGSS